MSGPSTIARVRAWEALDSRGTPTVACRIELADGSSGAAIAPAGASTGRHEARERRDGGQRYGGRGVLDAVAALRDELGPALIGRDAADQSTVDARLKEVDGTADLGRTGANAVLAASLAAGVAAAGQARQPLWTHWTGSRPAALPLPMVNVLSGGAHAARALDIQDVLVVPVGAATLAEAIEWAGRVRHAAVEEAVGRGLNAHLVADEGGLGLPLATNADALGLVHAAIERSGLEPGGQVAIAVDVAATQLFANGRYTLACEDRTLDAAGMVDELERWCANHPVVSIEDPLAEDDWAGWEEAMRRLGARVQLLGDDLFATDLARLERGIADHAANAVLVKPNQAGTVTDALDVLRRAQTEGVRCVVSARSGDTEDGWLADLATGTGAGQIKVGSTMRSERTAKWNRLLELEAVTDPPLPFAAGELTYTEPG